METEREHIQGLFGGDFLNFLRGMETYGRWSCKPLQSPFLNFLRGMETAELYDKV